MDVQCERCKTEYEFDDALVSGRGTTVRCTHCGHQFKVRRADIGDAAGDRWVVQTGNGQQLTFLTLRELQRAILAKQVARSDTLAFGDAMLRPLGSITELEPFFEGRSSSRPPPASADSAAAHGSVFRSPQARSTQSFGASPDHVNSIPSAPVPTPVPPNELTFHVDRAGDASATVKSSRTGYSPSTPGLAAVASVGTPPLVEREEEEMSSALPPPTVPVRRSMPSADDEMQDRHSAFPSSSDDVFDVPRRRRVGGWVVTFVLLLAVAVVGWVVAKPYLVAREAGITSHLDARALAFLADGEKALADGDHEGAQEDFDKASALAEGDPRVLLDEARVATTKADVVWLKLRLLPADAADETRTTRAELDQRVSRARKAADDALSAAPEDRAAVRVKIDALRIQGEREAARGYVSKVNAIASQSETAYVLAALDLAEAEPLWTTVIERLRLAAAAEGNAGRARAALVYALAKSGDAAGARAELAKLDSLPRPYPCSPNLHALIDKAALKAPTERTPAMNAPRGAMSNASTPLPSPMPVAGGVAGGGQGVPGDQSSAMHAASVAIKKGDWTQARHIYEGMVSRNPGDSEALAGIGDVDRAQGDTQGAIGAYKRALAVNPSYLPALLGVADTEWASGDRVSARQSYKDIVDRFPEGTYPSYVKTRSEPSSPAAPSATSAMKPYDPGDGI